MPKRPVVSVVVATYGRADRLPRLVTALAGQRGVEDFEVVVVDDASPDETPQVLDLLATRTPFLRVVRLAVNSGPATARNAGWRAAQAPLVAFTDDDCVPQPGWLAAVVSGLRHADLVQGRTSPDPQQSGHSGPFSRTMSVEREDGYYQTCNMGYRRDWLERLGGFDERFRRPSGEDTDLAWRARESGARPAFVEDALVYHDVRPSDFLVHVRDLARWGDVVLTLREHPQLRSLLHRRLFFRATHPSALVAGGGLLLLGAPRTGVGARLAGVLLLVPYLRLRTTTMPLLGGPRRRLVAIPAALVSDLAEVGVMVVASVRYRTLVL